MRRLRDRLRPAFTTYGVDPWLVCRSVAGWRQYRRNSSSFEALRRQDGSATEFPMGEKWPCLADRFQAGGVASGQYFHQDLLVAQWIFAANPQRHVDVGSRIDGFVAHVASFRPIDVLDIRPVTSSCTGINFFERNIMDADESWDGCCDSVSCLHAIEHFGLGRYNDPLDPDGWRKGWSNVIRMVRPGGTVYLSTMIGPQRIEFDAHRVFAVPTLLRLVESTFTVDEVAFIDDDGELHTGVDPHGESASRSFGCQSGCVIFRMTRLP